jgi:ABC-2 type transport system permease protein
MVLGSVFRTEQQVGGAALLLGIGFAALGGSMVPLELFGDTVRTVALVTPHAWANNAFSEPARHGGLVDVLPELAVLVGYAVVLFTFGAWRLHRTLSR